MYHFLADTLIFNFENMYIYNVATMADTSDSIVIERQINPCYENFDQETTPQTHS